MISFDSDKNTLKCARCYLMDFVLKYGVIQISCLIYFPAQPVCRFWEFAKLSC